MLITVVKEAETGHLPVKGQGYRGRFGGEGGMECGQICPRLYAPQEMESTAENIFLRKWILAYRPPYLQFNAKGESIGEVPKAITLPLPLLLMLRH